MLFPDSIIHRLPSSLQGYLPADAPSFGYLLFVLVVGSFALIVTGIRGGRLLVQLQHQLGAMSGIASGDPDHYAKVHQSFKGLKLFQAHWEEFDATLIKKGDQVLTTTDASQFFNEYTLVDEPLKMEFARHIPGILTALGIVGTFFGLILGLRDFSDANIQESVTKLLGGVQTAFTCSFVAVLLSVMVTITERSLITALYAKVHQLQEGLNRLFHRSLTEDYLHDMVGHMDQQSQALKSFSQDLAEAIRQALQELVDRQTTSMQQANQMIAGQISSAMNQTMGPAVERLATAVQDMQQKQVEGSQQALQDLVSQFGTTMSQVTGRQIEGLMAGMTATTDTLSSLKSEMGQFIQTVQQQMQSQQEQLSRQMTALSSMSSNQQQQLQEQLTAFVAGTADTLQSLQKQMAESSTDSVSRLGTEIHRIVAETGSQQQQAMTTLTSAMTGMQDQLDQRMQAMMSSLSAATSANTRDMSQVVESSVNRLNEQTGQMLNDASGTMQQMLKELSERTGQLVGTSAQLQDQLAQRFEQLTEM